MPLSRSRPASLTSAPTAPDAAALDGHRRAQRLAYAVAEEVANRLDAEMTERDAAEALRRAAEARGVDEWFHVPFAWFGPRAAFPGRWHARRFFPTSRRLVPGDAFILDLAPVVDGWAADVGHSGVFGESAAWDLVADDLAAHRRVVLDGVRSGATLAEVYRAVDGLARRQGLRSCHRRYPGHVLGHKVGWRPGGRGPDVVAGFGRPALRFLGGEGRRGPTRRPDPRTPLWNDGPGAEVRPSPGLWAVEPHLALRDVGAKWEELLVVDADGHADWLDDDLPHHRRWSARGVAW